MSLNQSKKRVSGLILTFFMLIGITVVSTTTAQAQWARDRERQERNQRERERENRRRDRNWDRDRDNNYRRNDRYGNYGNYGYNNYQYALNQGYQAGLNTGASDAQRGQSYNPQRSHYYRNNNGGGGQYQQAFREGFLRGYQDGFGRYGGYNNHRRNIGSWFPW